MAVLDPALLDRSSPDATDRATRALEALVLKQLLRSSGVFNGGSSPGSSIRTDLFADALADAVANAGGVGLGAQLSASLPAPTPAPTPGANLPRGVVDDPVLALVEGGHKTSGFGTRKDPIHGQTSNHPGVDVAAPEGTPIHVAADGVVRSAGPRGGYGFAVEVDHGNGLTTLYAHASELLVQPGDRVEQGQAIAKVGSTGRSTGPHLHFEVRQGDRPTEPIQALGKALKAYSTCADERVER